MWNLFKKSTKYPRQVLHPKQLALIEYIDNQLITQHKNPVSGQMKVCFLGLDLRTTLLPLNFITDKINLETGDSYIPRSVSLLVDSSGNWLIYYAIRSEVSSDELTISLFLDALNRTNDARSKGETNE